VGDAAAPAPAADVGTALPVYLDYVSVTTGAVVATVALPVHNTPGGPRACTLAAGDDGPTSVTWFFDTEGLPSTSVDGTVVVLPCHAAPIGSRIGAVLNDNKTIAVLTPDGRADTARGFVGYTGTRGTATGIRQLATTDGREFWVGGIASRHYGLRYLAPADGPSTVPRRVMGSVTYEDGHYQPGTVDLRGLAVYRGQLYMTSAYITERNKNLPAPLYTPWGGLVRLGDYGALVRNSSNDAVLLRGFTGRRNLHTFLFEASSTALWVLEDTSSYVPAEAVAAGAQVASFAAAALSRDAEYRTALAAGPVALAAFASRRPMLTRPALGAALVRWAWRDGAHAQWVEEADRKVYWGGEALYSLAGRWEVAPPAGGGGGGPAPPAPRWYWLYVTGKTSLYRVHGTSRAWSRLAAAPATSHFRGVAIPPADPAASAPVSATATPSDTPPASPTRSRSAKPRRLL
jgi:hypothetical protein